MIRPTRDTSSAPLRVAANPIPEPRLPTIHPTALIDPAAVLHESVHVGPYCIIEAGVRIDEGTRLIAHVHLQGPLTLGKRNVLHPFVALGGPPQDLKFDPATPGSGLVIGDDNLFREGVTLHRATQDKPTTVGDRNFFMANAHAGHDCVVGNDCMLANGALLAGHVTLGDRVVMGGNAGIGQFVRVGRLCMISGAEGASRDVPPFCIVHPTHRVCGLNNVGLRRAGYRDHLPRLRRAFDILYRQGHTTPHAVDLIRAQLADDPLCLELADFAASAERGITQYQEYK